MNHSDYEALTFSMVQHLESSAPRLAQCTVSGGATNRVTGASGFPHQVDVTVHNPTNMLLIECKYWAEPVDVEPVLVLAARIIDIRAGFAGTNVFGSMVSTKEPTNGARVIAAHFDISIDVVKSADEYALRVFDHDFVGINDGPHASDSYSIDVIRGGTDQ